MLNELLRIANEWWNTGAIGKTKAQPYQREVFNELRELGNQKNIGKLCS